jgi:hypothetical protein
MVHWCRDCNALLGVREPITNWTTVRTGLCASCQETKRDRVRLDRGRDERNEAASPEEKTAST